jgi:hypothetical protein
MPLGVDRGRAVRFFGGGGGEFAYVLKIKGLKMNAPTWTDSGNPILDDDRAAVKK